MGLKTQDTQVLHENEDWRLVADTAGYVAINRPVYFAYDTNTPTVAGEYTKENKIIVPADTKVYLKSVGLNHTVSYTVVEEV